MNSLFDVRCLIHDPYWDCPSCMGSKTFGVLSIYSDSYTRRCMQCNNDQHFPLPKIKKKVIYLDQFVISNIMKCLNPDWKVKGKNKIDPVWKEIFSKLNVLAKKQLIICPDSTTHFDESVVYSAFRKLKQVYESFSYGTSFYDFHTIERFHLCLCAENWINNNLDGNLLLNVEDIIHGNIHGWQDRINISADLGLEEAFKKDLISSNIKKNKAVVDLFSTWKKIKGFNFNEQYQLELDSYGSLIISSYKNHLTNLQKTLMNSNSFDPLELLNNEAQIFQSVQEIFTDKGYETYDSAKLAVEFFCSNYLKEMPFLKISALMWAILARRAAISGQKKIPSGSIVNDIKTISNILPYVDAIFIDRECASILDEASKYFDNKTKIFTINKANEFIKYLDDINDNMTEIHRNNIEEVYGGDYFQPFFEMFYNS